MQLSLACFSFVVSNSFSSTPRLSASPPPSSFPFPLKIPRSSSNPMSDSGDVPMEKQPAPPEIDVEGKGNAAAGSGGSSVLQRWKGEDLMRKGSIGLRFMALLFSVLSFVIMASNKHGDWMNFDKYEEYRYLLGIAILSTLYTGWQSVKHIHEFTTGKGLTTTRNTALVDFFGDQIVAYLLLSSASAAVPLTNNMRRGSDNVFTDASAAAISMSFFAFFALCVSAMISGYRLSIKSYI